MFQNTLLMKYLIKHKFLIFFIIFSIVSYLVIFFANRSLSVKNIEVISDRKFLLANQSSLINRSLIFVNREEISNKIIQENFLLKEALVEIVWPSTLKVTVSFYNPIASLIVNQGYFNLSSDGRILSKIKNISPSLPTINYYQKLNNSSFQSGEWIEYKDIKQALFFIDKLKQLNLTPLTIDIKGQDMLLFKLADDRLIIFSNEKDKETQLYELELIIRQFKIEGKEFKKIDLRFNKPVIGF